MDLETKKPARESLIRYPSREWLPLITVDTQPRIKFQESQTPVEASERFKGLQALKYRKRSGAVGDNVIFSTFDDSGDEDEITEIMQKPSLTKYKSQMTTKSFATIAPDHGAPESSMDGERRRNRLTKWFNSESQSMRKNRETSARTLNH
jgi:hypothetical protein